MDRSLGLEPQGSDLEPSLISDEAPRSERSGDVSVPIPGTTKLDRLQENIGAAVIELTKDDLGDIDRALSTVPVTGAPL